MSLDLDYDADDQDQAETFDETNITDDGGDIAHPDMERDVLDVTHAEEDDEDDDFDDEAADEDFDPDEADDAEIDSMLEERRWCRLNWRVEAGSCRLGDGVGLHSRRLRGRRGPGGR